jgi:phosphotriesterase-related protein
MLNRRSFFRSGAIGAASVAIRGIAASSESRAIMTVTGAVELPATDAARSSGVRFLPHEHVVTDFLGAEKLPAPRYDRAAAFETIAPHFSRLRERGVEVLCECTPNHIGRDVRLLRRLSEASGVRILTNTGYYGAVENKFLPKHAYDETSVELAKRWLGEWRNGIDGTDVKPGFIKLGVGKGPLPELHRKLVDAAAMTHRASGLTVCIHTGDGVAALDELKLLESEGVAPEAFVWVHAQNDAGPTQIEIAKRGGWVSLDGYSVAARNTTRYRNMLIALKEAGCLNRVLISHDDGWAVEGDLPKHSTLKLFGNGNPEPYTGIFARLIPDLREHGFTEREIQQIGSVNPLEAMAVRKRLRDVG